MRVLIIGAGGHAHVIADILLQMKSCGAGLEPIGYLDDNPALTGQQVLGLPIRGSLTSLSTTAHEAVILAIGDNAIRRRVFSALEQKGECFVTACHPSAIVAPSVQIGPGTAICAGAVVNPSSVIGTNVILNTGCTVDHHNRIADHAHIAPGVHLGGDVSVGEGALVGIGAIVMPRRRVGAWTVVGGGALVRNDLPNGVVATGLPARVVRKQMVERI